MLDNKLSPDQRHVRDSDIHNASVMLAHRFCLSIEGNCKPDPIGSVISKLKKGEYKYTYFAGKTEARRKEYVATTILLLQELQTVAKNVSYLRAHSIVSFLTTLRSDEYDQSFADLDMECSKYQTRFHNILTQELPQKLLDEIVLPSDPSLSAPPTETPSHSSSTTPTTGTVPQSPNSLTPEQQNLAALVKDYAKNILYLDRPGVSLENKSVYSDLNNTGILDSKDTDTANLLQTQGSSEGMLDDKGTRTRITDVLKAVQGLDALVDGNKSEKVPGLIRLAETKQWSFERPERKKILGELLNELQKVENRPGAGVAGAISSISGYLRTSDYQDLFPPLNDDRLLSADEQALAKERFTELFEKLDRIYKTNFTGVYKSAMGEQPSATPRCSFGWKHALGTGAGFFGMTLLVGVSYDGAKNDWGGLKTIGDGISDHWQIISATLGLTVGVAATLGFVLWCYSRERDKVSGEDKASQSTDPGAGTRWESPDF